MSLTCLNFFVGFFPAREATAARAGVRPGDAVRVSSDEVGASIAGQIRRGHHGGHLGPAGGAGGRLVEPGQTTGGDDVGHLVAGPAYDDVGVGRAGQIAVEFPAAPIRLVSGRQRTDRGDLGIEVLAGAGGRSSISVPVDRGEVARADTLTRRRRVDAMKRQLPREQTCRTPRAVLLVGLAVSKFPMAAAANA